MGYLIENRTVSREVPEVVGATCDNCDLKLTTSVGINVDGSWVAAQPKDALNITIYGGYGMWSDEENASIVLCADCIDKLWRAFPAFKKALKVDEVCGRNVPSFKGWHEFGTSDGEVVFQCNAPTLAESYESESRRADVAEGERDSLKAQLARAVVCGKCKGAGGKRQHQRGITHYETDAGEGCPDYHYETIPCAVCGGRGVVLGGEKAR